GVLDLDARVHLDEHVLAGALPRRVEQELDRAGVDVADRLGEGDRVAVQRRAGVLVEVRGRRDLDDLLVAALHGAVALEEVHRLARVVGEDLHLDVAGAHDRLLDEQAGVAEGAVGLAHRRLERGTQLLTRVDPAHAAAAAARDRLREDGEADLIGARDERVDVGRRRCRLQHGHAGGDRVILRGDLVAGHLEHLRARADEGDAVLGRRARQLGVLGEEAVAGVDRIRTAQLGDPDDLRDVEVGADRVPLLADQVRLVRLQAVHRVAVLPRVHGDRPGPQLVRRPERADRDLTSVGNQDLREHAVLSADRVGRDEGLGSFRLVKVGWLLVHVLSVSSLKGGVGKTTVTLGLASAAFARGISTLVVDLDPQSDVSTGLDIDITGHLNIADVLASPKEKIVRAAIARSGWTRGRSGKIDVLIGSPSAINFDGPHPSIRDIWKLEEALAFVEKEYEL